MNTGNRRSIIFMKNPGAITRTLYNNQTETGGNAFNRLFKTGLYVLIIAVLLFFMPLGPVNAQDNPPADGTAGKAYIILVDRLSIYDISPEITPEIYGMVQKGGLGLAANRTLRGQNNIDSSLTIGAGNFARAYTNGIMAYNHDELVTGQGKTASQFYYVVTGYEPGDSEVLLVNLPEVVTGMMGENVTTTPGALGEILQLNHLKTAVLGNSDYMGTQLRLGAALGMNASGQAALGDVGDDTLIDLPRRYLNQGTNYPYLRQKLSAISSSADLIIVELSDLARWEKAFPVFPALQSAEKIQCLQDIDRMTGHILNGADMERDLVLLFPVSPATEQFKLKNSFLPIIAWGKDITPGALSSGSTRRDFIIASTDIAPTIINFFQAENEGMSIIGLPVRSLPYSGDTLEAARNISASTSTTTRLRTILVKSYVVAQIIVILLAVLALLWVKPLRNFAQALVLSLVTVPLILLFLGKIPLPNDNALIIAAVLLVVLITALVTRLYKNSSPFNAFIFISGITLLALVIDSLTGTRLIQSSVLGYDPMVGARYYGIGNEYMGIMVGAAIITAAALFEKYPSRWFLALLAAGFLFLCFIIGNPSLGAQSDGFITAPIAFAVTIFLLSNLKMHWGYVAAAAGIILAAIAGLIGYELSKPLEMQSHLGRFFHHLIQGGTVELSQTLLRKASMNIKLIRYTIWSRVFLVMLLVLSLLVFRPVGALKQLLQERPFLVKGFAGLITGAIVALLINDSGIVAASTTCIYLVPPIILLTFEMQQNNSSDELTAIAENKLKE
jgi:hypothetical protein